MPLPNVRDWCCGVYGLVSVEVGNIQGTADQYGTFDAFKRLFSTSQNHWFTFIKLSFRYLTGGSILSSNRILYSILDSHYSVWRSSIESSGWACNRLALIQNKLPMVYKYSFLKKCHVRHVCKAFRKKEWNMLTSQLLSINISAQVVYSIRKRNSEFSYKRWNWPELWRSLSLVVFALFTTDISWFFPFYPTMVMIMALWTERTIWIN